MVCIVDFDDGTLTRIFSTILDWALTSAPFPANIKVGKLSLCFRDACMHPHLLNRLMLGAQLTLASKL